MKLLRLQLFIVILLTYIGAIISKWWDSSIKPLPMIITAIVSILIAYCVGFIDEKLSTPSLDIKINKGQKDLLISINSTKALETLAIDLPILGKVTNIHDNNSITDARTSKRIVGDQTDLSQNNVEFMIENLKEMNPLEYKIFFEPMSANIFIGGTDRYKVSYFWYYNGNLKSRIKWLSLIDGKEVEKPNIVIKGATIIKRALTPEEVKKRYEEGLKKRNIG